MNGFFGIGVGRERFYDALFGNEFAVDEDFIDFDRVQVVKQNHIRAFRGRDRAHFMVELIALRHVYGHHLNGGNGIYAERDRAANDMIEMPLFE